MCYFFRFLCSFNKSIVFTKEQNFIYAPELKKQLENNGCKVLTVQTMFLLPDEVREHYPHIVDKPFFPDTLQQFDEYPITIMLVRGRMKKILKTIGTKTDASLCATGSFRKTRGEGKEHNAAHRTGSFWERFVEWRRFFGKNGFVTKYRNDPERQLKDFDKLAKLREKMEEEEIES